MRAGFSGPAPLGSGAGKAFDDAIDAYSAILDEHKKPALALILLFIVFMGSQAIRLEVDGSQDAFFYENDPAVMSNDRVDAQFGSADAMTIFLRIDKASTQTDRIGSIDDTQVLEYIGAIERKMMENGFVQSVVTPLEDPYLLNRGGGSALILAYLDLGEGEKELQDRKGRIEEIAFSTKRPTGLKVSVGGAPVIFSEVSRLLFADLIKTGLVSLILIGLCVRVFYGNDRMTLVSLFVLGSIMISIFGTMQILGVPLNIATALIAVLTIGIGVDYTLHLQNGFIQNDGPRARVLSSTLKRIGPPLSMAFLTTVIGFLSLFFAGSKVMETLAISTSVGIVYIFLFNITLTPLLFLLFGIGQGRMGDGRPQGRIQRFLRERMIDLSGVIGNHTWIFLACMGAVIVIVGFGITNVDTKTDYSGFIPADNPIVVDMNEQGDAFPSSLSRVNVIIEADDVLEEAVLDDIDRFEKRLRTLEFVESVRSPVDEIKEMNGGVIPETRTRLVDHPEISSGYGMMRVSIVYGGLASSDQDVLLDSLLPAIMEEFPEGRDAYFSGEAALSVRERQVMSEGQGAVTLFSFALIFVLLIAYFRSIPLGLMIMIPIALAIVSAMGMNGWTSVPFSQITSSIFGIIIGLGMDFAIYTSSEMRRHLELGEDYEGALEETHEHLAKLLYLTSLTTVLGFLALQLADLRFLRDLGITLAFGILFAFLYSMLLLPGLIVAYYRIRRWLSKAMEGRGRSV